MKYEKTFVRAFCVAALVFGLTIPSYGQITVTEQHRLGVSVNVAVTSGNTIVYDRYVSAVDWDGDAEAVVAAIKQYLDTEKARVAAVVIIPAKPKTVTMTNKQVTDKLAAIEAEKQAAIKAAIIPKEEQ